MLVRIYEVQPHYKIIYFHINVTILYIILKYVVIILSFIVTNLSSVLIGYYFQIFIIFYFISILVPNL